MSTSCGRSTIWIRWRSSCARSRPAARGLPTRRPGWRRRRDGHCRASPGHPSIGRECAWTPGQPGLTAEETEIDMLARDQDILQAAEEWRRQGRKVALATVVETWGSAPRPVGSNLVIDQEGNFLGSVSGGCVEGAVV